MRWRLGGAWQPTSDRVTDFGWHRQARDRHGVRLQVGTGRVLGADALRQVSASAFWEACFAPVSRLAAMPCATRAVRRGQTRLGRGTCVRRRTCHPIRPGETVQSEPIRDSMSFRSLVHQLETLDIPRLRGFLVSAPWAAELSTLGQAATIPHEPWVAGPGSRGTCAPWPRSPAMMCCIWRGRLGAPCLASLK